MNILNEITTGELQALEFLTAEYNTKYSANFTNEEYLELNIRNQLIDVSDRIFKARANALVEKAKVLSAEQLEIVIPQISAIIDNA